MPKHGHQQPRTDWRDYAACRGMDTDLFFPMGSTAITKAKGVCSDCPVREECLRLATDLAIEDGIWGGLTDAERRSIRRRPHRRRPYQGVDEP